MARSQLPVRVIHLVLCIGLGGLFVWAGVYKALHPQQFVTDIASYRLLPHWLVVVTALYLPWLEIVTGSAVITGLARRGGMLILTVLMAVFLLALLSAWWRGLNINCGCFGPSVPGSEPQFAWLVVRDVAILAGLAMAMSIEQRRRVVGSQRAAMLAGMDGAEASPQGAG